MDKKVLILIDSPITNRHHYVFDFLFNENLGLHYTVTSDISQFEQNNDSQKINYSGKQHDTPNCLEIFNQGFLEENQIHHTFQPDVLNSGKATLLFPAPANSTFDFGFDIFSACFYLLSRYEEYQNFEPDKHNRFCSSSSLAKKFDFIKFPLIDNWIELIRVRINSISDLKIEKAKYTFQPTYDIDIAWAFKHKGFIRTLGLLVRLLKSKNKQINKDIYNTLFNNKKDPYQVFDDLDNLHKTYSISNVIFFFAVGKWSAFDKNTSISNLEFQSLIQETHKKYELGIHPSYRSNMHIDILKSELKSLEKTVGENILKSRQHFLKLSFPTTYQNLIQQGIKEDYTLGYSDCIGFRASCSRSFLWYDLSEEKTSTLRLFPFQVMDVSLFNYMNLSPEEALDHTAEIISYLHSFGGTFRTIWHNSSFYTEEGWTVEKQKMYESILKEAIKHP